VLFGAKRGLRVFRTGRAAAACSPMQQSDEPGGDRRCSRDPTATGGRVVPVRLGDGYGVDAAIAFLTGGRVSRAGIASRATEASDVALFERETYEPG
jgi:hypothetical protein